jgi:hypothetical protein
MNLGSSSADIGLTVLLLFPALLAPMLLIGLGVLIGRILHLPGSFPIFFVFGTIAAIFALGSLALDSMAGTVPGLVERRIESVDLRPQGDWQHNLHVSVRYRLDGSPPILDQPAPDESATTFNLSTAQFDRLSEGGITSLRVLPLFRSLALVRLADIQTINAIPWFWIGVAFGVLLLFWLAGRLMASRSGSMVIVAIVLVAGMGLPSALAYRQWQASEDLTSRPLRTTAIAREVSRITKVDPFPCTPGSGSRCSRRNTQYDVAQPYDIVQIGFVPEGAGGPVIAVDAIDAGSVPVQPGASMTIAYAATDPRAAQILGANHSHHWRNALGLAALFGAIALLVASILWWAIQRHGRTQQRAPVPQQQ